MEGCSRALSASACLSIFCTEACIACCMAWHYTALYCMAWYGVIGVVVSFLLLASCIIVITIILLITAYMYSRQRNAFSPAFPIQSSALVMKNVELDYVVISK